MYVCILRSIWKCSSILIPAIKMCSVVSVWFLLPCFSFFGYQRLPEIPGRATGEGHWLSLTWYTKTQKRKFTGGVLVAAQSSPVPRCPWLVELVWGLGAEQTEPPALLASSAQHGKIPKLLLLLSRAGASARPCFRVPICDNRDYKVVTRV